MILEAVRYFIFKFTWRRKHKNWRDCRHKNKAMKRDWEKLKNKLNNKKSKLKK